MYVLNRERICPDLEWQCKFKLWWFGWCLLENCTSVYLEDRKIIEVWLIQLSSLELLLQSKIFCMFFKSYIIKGTWYFAFFILTANCFVFICNCYKFSVTFYSCMWLKSKQYAIFPKITHLNVLSAINLVMVRIMVPLNYWIFLNIFL